ASEYGPFDQSFAADHAMRNRLIAASAKALVIVEAGAGSGTLGTAIFAKRMGVPMFASPAEVGGERGGIDGLMMKGEISEWNEQQFYSLLEGSRDSGASASSLRRAGPKGLAGQGPGG